MDPVQGEHPEIFARIGVGTEKVTKIRKSGEENRSRMCTRYTEIVVDNAGVGQMSSLNVLG